MTFSDSSLPTAEEYRADISAIARQVHTNSNFSPLSAPPLPAAGPPSHPPLVNGSHAWRLVAARTHSEQTASETTRHSTSRPHTEKESPRDGVYMNLDDLHVAVDSVELRPVTSRGNSSSSAAHARFSSTGSVDASQGRSAHARVMSLQQPLDTSIVEIRSNEALTSSLPVGLRVLPLTTDDSAAMSCELHVNPCQFMKRNSCINCTFMQTNRARPLNETCTQPDFPSAMTEALLCRSSTDRYVRNEDLFVPESGSSLDHLRYSRLVCRTLFWAS